MSFIKGLKKGASVVGQAAQEAAATAKLEAELKIADTRFNSTWGKLQEAYPTDEADHVEVRELLAQKQAGHKAKDILLIDAATKRLEVIVAKNRAEPKE